MHLSLVYVHLKDFIYVLLVPVHCLLLQFHIPQSKNVKLMQIQLFLRQNWQAFGTCAKTPVPFSDSYHGLCPFFRYVN